MKQLKCLENFVVSKSFYYNEETMQLMVISMLKERGVEIEDIAFCQLTSKDVVRHPLVQKIVKAYEVYETKENAREKNNVNKRSRR